MVKYPDIKKKLMEEVVNNGGVLTHDYANDLHFSYILELLGGKESLKINYPQIYKSLCYTRKLSQKNKLVVLENENDDLKDVTNRIEYIAYQPNVDIQSSMLGSYAERKPAIIITGEMIDVKQDKILDCFSYEAYDSYNLEGITRCLDEGMVQSQDRVFRSEATFIWTDVDKNNLRMGSQTLISEEVKQAGASSIVKEITVEDPMPHSNQRTDTVVVYNREAQVKEGFDYSYPNVMKDNKVKVNLPVKGKVEFQGAWVPKGVDFNKRFKVQLELEDEGIVEYSNLVNANFFEINGNTLSWDFNNDWESLLNTQHFNASTVADFYCSMCINLFNANVGVSTAVPIVIKSGKGQDTSKDPSVKIIPKIKIQWGCFGKDTLIMMADGTYKNITEVEILECVKGKDKKGVAIKNIFIGDEKELIRIVTNKGKCLEVTMGHPICTTKGMKAAEFLKASDRIKTVDGIERISELRTIFYDDKVYNLDIGEAETLICSGIYTGDYQMQNCAMTPTDKIIKNSKTVIEFQKEMQDMCKKLKNRG